MIIQHQGQPQLSMGHHHHEATVDDSSVAIKANHSGLGSMAIQHSSSSSGGSSTTTTTTTTTVGAQLQIPPPQEAKLMESLRTQVEFYFSPMNYANDAYLQQYSAAYAGSVPLSVIASFPKVRELFAGANVHAYAEIQLLVQALEASDMLIISSDGLWIAPSRPILLAAAPVTPANVSMPLQMVPSPQDTTETSSQSTVATQPPSSSKERTTIIVRDLPLECDEEDVMNAFSTESNSPKSARLDVGNTWYVQFESESQALEALAASQHRLIDGHPIKARLKSELSAPTTTTAPPRHVETTNASTITHHHQQQHPPHYNMAMPQHYYNHHGGMHHHHPSYAVMPPIYANHMPYGMAAMYPMNTQFYMDHPQHLMPPMPQQQQMSYVVSEQHLNTNNKKHNKNTHNQKQRNHAHQAETPNLVYVRNYHQRNNNNNDGGDSSSHYNINSQSNMNPKDKTKTQNRPTKNKNKKKNLNNNNNNNNNSGERRMEQQASARGESPSRGYLGSKERRDHPSPPTGRNKNSLQGSDSFQSDQSNSNGHLNHNRGNNKKTNKLTKKSLNPINNNNGGGGGDDANNKPNNNATNNKKKRVPNNKKKLHHQRSSSMSSTTSSKILNEDQFPALTTQGGSSKHATKQRGGPVTAAPPRAAYAEALLKPCTKKPALDSADEIQAAFERITTEENQQYEDAMCW